MSARVRLHAVQTPSSTVQTLIQGLLTIYLGDGSQLAFVIRYGALRNRNYLTRSVTGVGAIGLGFNATTCFCEFNEALGVDTTEQ